MAEQADTQASMPQPSPRYSWGRWLLLAAVLTALALFYLTGLYRSFTWQALKQNQSELHSLVERRPLETVAIFFSVYVLAAALSLPAAAVLTVAAGVVFDRLWLGTLVVSLASTTGATLAFLGSRYLFRDHVQRRFGPRLEALNREIEANGAFYLLTLRLVPVVPFFLINVAMGQTRIRVWTFWWVSQVGMLPGTMLYVNAGTQLGRINEMKDILSWQLGLSLALLGVVPLLLRKGVQWWQAHRRPRPS